MPLVIDIGVYDGADTEYYLETGHRVIAVEANPAWVAHARRSFAAYIASGQLEVIAAAIAAHSAPVTLSIGTANVAGASTVDGMVATDDLATVITVPGITMAEVLARAGERPRLIKIDIEGADALCLAALTNDNRPEALSVEVHDGPDAILPTLTALGFSRFKLIDQTTFRSLPRRGHLWDRLGRALMRRVFGMAGVKMVRRHGRFFALEVSSGPAPWDSDGSWATADDVSRQFAAIRSKGRLWYDLHAT
jgi:FkbM family methyltransferase